MRSLTAYLICATLVCFLSCAPALDLRDWFDPVAARLFDKDLLRAADVIIVGTVLSARSIGEPTPAIKLPEVKLQLTQITLRAEHLLKGEVRGPLVVFYFFTYSEKNVRDPGGFPVYHPAPNQREIFFLKNDHGHLRSVGDVGKAYTLRVWSGYHRNLNVGSNATVPALISFILLTPAEGCDTENFALYLAEASYMTGLLTSRDTAMHLLERLRDYPNERVRHEALQLLKANERDVTESRALLVRPTQ
jgi:hypothetical protein